MSRAADRRDRLEPTARSRPARARPGRAAAPSPSAGTGSTAPPNGGTLEHRAREDRTTAASSRPDNPADLGGGRRHPVQGRRRARIYRSDDGGAAGSRSSRPTRDNRRRRPRGGPRNPKRIFAAMWDHRRKPDDRTYGGSAPACSARPRRRDLEARKRRADFGRARPGSDPSLAVGSRARATPSGSTPSPPRRGQHRLLRVHRRRRVVHTAAPPGSTAASAGGSGGSSSTRQTRTTCSCPA